MKNRTIVAPKAISALRSAIGLLVLATQKIALTISFVSLIYVGVFSKHLSEGIALALFGIVLMPVIAAVFSSKRGIVCVSQDIPVLLISGLVASWATTLPDITNLNLFPTIVALIAVSALFTGFVLFVVGTFKLGSLARVIPYSVIGGFLASTGALLVLGALSMMTKTSLSFWTLPELLDQRSVLTVLPWVIFSLCATWAMRTYGGIALPVLLLLATGVFFSLLGLANISISEASAQGLLMGPFPTGRLLSGLSIDMVWMIDWTLIFEALPTLIAIAALATLGLLMNVSGLEVEQDEEFDFERELRAAGVANLAGGMVGGMPAYHFLSSSLFAHKMGLNTIFVGLSISAGAAAILAFGADLIAYLPIGMMASIVAILGFDLMVEWLWVQPRRLPLKDIIIIGCIVLTAMTVGFLTSLALGFGLAVFFFILSYSRISVVRYKTSGDLRRSHTERSQADQQRLSQQGRKWEIFELTGYLFFGSANLLYEQMKGEFSVKPAPDYAVFNFSRVSGIDTSTLFVFNRIQKLCATAGVTIIFSGLNEAVQAELGKSQLSDGIVVYPTLDEALISLEKEVLLVKQKAEEEQSSETLINQLAEKYPDLDFDAFAKTIKLSAGEALVTQGDDCKEIYELHEGELVAEVTTEHGGSIILARFQPGALVGEIATYAGVPRTATIKAAVSSTLTSIKLSDVPDTRDGYAVASQINKHVASSLAHRLIRMNNLYRETTL